MQSTDSLIQDYLAALRILDFEGPSVLGHDATVHTGDVFSSALLNSTSTPAMPCQVSPQNYHRYNSFGVIYSVSASW